MAATSRMIWLLDDEKDRGPAGDRVARHRGRHGATRTTRTEHDLLGRATKTIEAYVDGVASDGDDRTTDYAYDGNDNVLTMKAVLPGGAFQTTEYVYGVTAAGGSDVNSNALLAEVRFPDKTSGNPGSAPADKRLYRYNALGEVKLYTDHNQTTHEYEFDARPASARQGHDRRRGRGRADPPPLHRHATATTALQARVSLAGDDALAGAG